MNSNAVFILATILAFTFLISVHPQIHQIPILTNSPNPKLDPPFPRTGHNILYPTPHKTGSTSTAKWLSELSKASNLTYNRRNQYHFRNQTDLATRAQSQNCSILSGHIFTRSIYERKHEARFGSIITTSRDPAAQLCSKYFHSTPEKYNDTLPLLKDKSSWQSRRFWQRWLWYDVCETYRYYDGLEHCNTDLKSLHMRAEAIAGRIDCVIDTDDAQLDADAICRLVQVKDCPQFDSKNVRVGLKVGYGPMLELPHIRLALERPVRVLQVLRDALLKRRCRLLTTRGKPFGTKSTMGDLPPAKWPTVGCAPV